MLALKTDLGLSKSTIAWGKENKNAKYEASPSNIDFFVFLPLVPHDRVQANIKNEVTFVSHNYECK